MESIRLHFRHYKYNTKALADWKCKCYNCTRPISNNGM